MYRNYLISGCLALALCLCAVVAWAVDQPVPTTHSPSSGAFAGGLSFGTTTIRNTNAPPISGQCLEFNGTGFTGAACASTGGFPGGNTPQFAGFSALNTSEAETLGGDCTFSRAGANSYTIACLSSGGNLFTSSNFGSSLNLSTLLSQDCTVSPLGVMTCLRTNNVPFVASATTDTTNANNISSGTLTAARIPAGNICTNQAITAIGAALVGACNTITSAYVDTSIAKTGTDINTSNQVTATHLAAALPPAQGGTGSTTAPGSGQLAIGNGTVYVPKTASGSCTVDLNGVFTCSASGTYPGGNSPQIGGFSALNTSEAETVSGDFAFTRAGANSYTANVSQLLGGLMTFTGPTTSLKTYTLPNASTTILTTNSAVTAGQGGTGSASVPTGGQIPVGNAGGTAYAPKTMSGDGTLASTGAITVTKTSGTAFATSATTDTTNASNISSGTLAAGRGGTGSGTLPSSGQLLVGNAGGTAYAPVTATGSCTINSAGVFTCTGSNLSAYTGGVGITGNSNAGTDTINSVIVNNVFVPQDWGANGTNVTATCTITGGSATIACSNTGNLKVGQYVLLPHAGPASLITSPANAPVLTVVGATGTTHYSVKTVIADAWGGYAAAGAAATVTTGNAAMSPLTYVKVVDPAATSCPNSYCILINYLQVNGVGNYNFYDIIPYPLGPRTNSTSYPVPPASQAAIWPTTAPASGAAQNLVAKITAVVTNTSITLGTTPTTSVGPETVYPDDTQALQSCANAASAAKGICYLPAGTTANPAVYNTNQASYWNGTTWIYTNPTVAPTGNEMHGMVHLQSNTTIRGAGRNLSYIASYASNAIYSTLLDSSWGTSTTPPGALCDSGVLGVVTTYPVNNIAYGASIVTTTTAANAANFNPGDLVWYGGGLVDGNTSCGLHSTPENEMNQVLWTDATTGHVGLLYPSTNSYPVGAVGVAMFMADLTTTAPGVAQTDITVEDLTLAPYGGGDSLSVSNTVRFTVERVDMSTVGLTWDEPLDGAVRRFLMEDSTLRSQAWEEFAESNDVRFINNDFRFEGGGLGGLVMSDGSGNLLFSDNHFTGSDTYCGINPFASDACALGTTILLSTGPSDHGVRVINNEFNMQANLIGIGYASIAGSASDPVTDDVQFTGNTFNMFGTQVEALNAPASATRLIISHNRFNINATNTGVNSWAIQANSGNISNNDIQSPIASNAGQGLININAPLANWNVPLLISGNTFGALGTSNTNNVCIYFLNVNGTTDSSPITVSNNDCALGFGFQQNADWTAVVNLQNNTNTGQYVGTSWAPSGETWMGSTGATTLATGATNFVSLQGINVNSTEVNTQLVASRAGEIGQLVCNFGTNPGVAKSYAVTLRDNAASPASGPTCTANNATTCSDLTHSAVVAKGDLLDLQVVPSGTPSASTMQCSIQFGT